MNYSLRSSKFLRNARKTAGPSLPSAVLWQNEGNRENANKQLEATNKQLEDTNKQVEDAHQQIEAANKQIEDLKAQNQTFVAYHDAMNRDMKYMKYEVKKLKDAPAPEPVQERAVPEIPADLVQRVDDAQTQSSKATETAENANKQLESANQQIADLKNENDQLKTDVKCLKYEVKKLKEAPAPVPAPVEERAVPVIPDDLVERVDTPETTSTAHTQTADAAHAQRISRDAQFRPEGSPGNLGPKIGKGAAGIGILVAAGSQGKILSQCSGSYWKTTAV